MAPRNSIEASRFLLVALVCAAAGCFLLRSAQCWTCWVGGTPKRAIKRQTLLVPSTLHVLFSVLLLPVLRYSPMV